MVVYGLQRAENSHVNCKRDARKVFFFKIMHWEC